MTDTQDRDPIHQPKSIQEFTFLVFRVGNIHFAQPVERLREVIRYREAQRVPYVPDFIEGVINIRGEIIPILDLRKRLNLPADITRKTRILLTWIRASIMGLVVDEAHEIIRVRLEQIQPVDTMTPVFLRPLVIGAITLADTRGERIILLPDFELLLRPEEEHEWIALKERGIDANNLSPPKA